MKTTIVKKRKSKIRHRASSLLYNFNSINSGNYRGHEISHHEYALLPHILITSVLRYVKVPVNLIRLYVGGIRIDLPFGHYSTFTTNTSFHYKNLTHKRYAEILRVISTECGIISYKGKTYWCDYGSLYTYPNFEPIMLNITIPGVRNVIAIDKCAADIFIKGFANIVQKGAYRYRKMYSRSSRINVICVYSFVPNSNNSAIICTQFSGYMITADTIGRVQYRIDTNGMIRGQLDQIQMNTDSVNYLQRI